MHVEIRWQRIFVLLGSNLLMVVEADMSDTWIE